MEKYNFPLQPRRRTPPRPHHSRTPPTRSHPQTTHRMRARKPTPTAYPTATAKPQTLLRNSRLRWVGTVGLKLGALLLLIVIWKTIIVLAVQCI